MEECRLGIEELRYWAEKGFFFPIRPVFVSADESEKESAEVVTYDPDSVGIAKQALMLANQIPFPFLV